MIKEGYPLPCIRTLQKRTEHLKLGPGIFDDVIEMLGNKLSSKSNYEKFYSLTLDEMSLKSGSEMVYDLKSDSFIGDATLPGHSGPASKALVFQIASIGGPRLKQVVGFHFTPSSVQSEVMAEIIKEIIAKCHKSQIYILNVTADAGPSNRGAFK